MAEGTLCLLPLPKKGNPKAEMLLMGHHHKSRGGVNQIRPIFLLNSLIQPPPPPISLILFLSFTFFFFLFQLIKNSFEFEKEGGGPYQNSSAKQLGASQ